MENLFQLNRPFSIKKLQVDLFALAAKKWELFQIVIDDVAIPEGSLVMVNPVEGTSATRSKQKVTATY